MKTMILYFSQYGTTEKCAKYLAEQLTGEVEVKQVTKKEPVEINMALYDRIILGGSIRVGKVQKEIQQLCTRYQEVLLQKELGLFLCCGLPEQPQDVFESNFGEQLVQHAVVGNFCGELNTDRMGFFAKKIVQTVAKSKDGQQLPEIDWREIEVFADALENKTTKRT